MAAASLKGEKVHDREPDSPSRTQISFVDIARAYFCASTDPNDPTYVELPSEDGGRERGLCGLLLKHMYGTKKAADGWHCEYSGALSDLGFTAGMASAWVFRHPSRGLACSVHGDDLTTEGPKDQLDWFVGELRKKYLGQERVTTKRRVYSTDLRGGQRKALSMKRTLDRPRGSCAT